MRDWRLAYAPRAWQIAALDRWSRDRRGIVEVVTGGGKTVFAFAVIEQLQKDVPNLRVLIVVPSVALADQWTLSLTEELGVRPDEIGALGGGEQPRADQPIVVAVINSARGRSAKLAELGPTLLVVDECHRAGSPRNANAIEGAFVATLGLSATPERDYDDGFVDIIVPALGKIIFQYDYVAAARDGVIASFRLTNIEVPRLMKRAMITTA